MTPTELKLFAQLRDQPTLVSKILELELKGKSRQQIAQTLGYSKAYINNVHSKAKRQFEAIDNED